ncbi:Ribosomal RNA large subunit methyltransferase K [Phycisphaerales bacterium]|nr:Ribosomal RNA large subunit methyltransferase K [Phycisphaerales bacterium]
MAADWEILAVTNFGLEAVAVRELRALGYEAKGVSTGRVLFRGDARAVARANLWLRTADRVLIRVATFPAKDFEALFEGVKAIAWEEWIPADFAFPVDGRSVKSQLSSVPACQRATKKAIVDRLMKAHRTQTLPETGPTVRVEISLLNDVATLTIDTSGAGLHKRGYRPVAGEAALKETLAAGLVMLSVWRGGRPLVDPFCGTGTIAIEAALWARNIAPGLKRSFDGEKWPALGEAAWREARDEAAGAPRGDLAYAIHASDLDERALAIGRRAAAAAGVERDVHFKKQAFEDLSTKADYGCIVTNPPWGERLGEQEEIERLYRTMPLVFRRLPTWSFHVLTARLDLEEIVGQKATRRRKFYNAQIECWYFQFLGPRPGKNAEEDRGRNEEDGAGKGIEEKGPEEVIGDGGEGGKAIEESSARESDETVMAGSGSAEPKSSPSSSGSLRFPPRSPPRSPPAAFGGLRERDVREVREFGACLAKNVRHLRRYPSRGITCYRVYERDQVDVPLIIDVYEGRVHVAEYEREHSRTIAQQADWWDAVEREIAAATGVPVERIFTKEKHRQSDFTQHEKVEESGERVVVQEGGLRFEVNLRDYIDTGLFLDHRLTRAMVREQASGKRFLNLFCYTGAFTVYAAAGGAAETMSVDLSNTYLDWAKRNLELNGLWGPRHRLVKSDVLEFLRGHPPGEHYDLAVVDPPTFSRSKSTPEDWEVAEGHTELLGRVLGLMSPGGVVYFSTNYRRFKLDEEALGAAGATWREISAQTVPPEYRNRRVHRCWRVVKG